jgi:hypothetical protein
MISAALLQRVQALEAAPGAINSSSSSSTSTASPAAVTFLTAPVTVATQSGAGALAATWFNASAYIPAGATAVLLRMGGQCNAWSSPPQTKSMYFQSSSGGPVWTAWTTYNQAGATDYEGNAELWILPVSAQGFFYSWDSNIQNISIQLWGYLG